MGLLVTTLDQIDDVQVHSRRGGLHPNLAINYGSNVAGTTHYYKLFTVDSNAAYTNERVSPWSNEGSKTFTNESKTVDASSASGQKVLNLDSTEGVLVGDRCLIDEGVSDEWGIVDSIQDGVSVTLFANLANTYTNETVIFPKLSNLISWGDGTSDGFGNYARLVMTDEAGNYAKNNTANMYGLLNNAYAFNSQATRGQTTLNGGVSRGDSTIIVVSDTNFNGITTGFHGMNPQFNSHIVIDRGKPNEEVVSVQSKSTTTFTLAQPLCFDHDDGADVREGILDDGEALRGQVDWDTAYKMQPCQPGIAHIDPTDGSWTAKDLYDNADLKDKFVFRRSYNDSESDAFTDGHGTYEMFLSSFLGDWPTIPAVNQATLDFSGANLRWWGRFSTDVTGQNGGLTTITLGELDGNVRNAGCYFQFMSQRTVTHFTGAQTVWNVIDSTIAGPSAVVAAGSLSTGTNQITALDWGWGDDFNGTFSGQWNVERSTLKNYFKFFFQAPSAFTTLKDFFVSKVENFEPFYTSGVAQMHFRNTTIEGSDIAMAGVSNPQQAEDGKDLSWENMTIIDAGVAELSLISPININLIDLTVVGGSGTNTDFNVRFDTSHSWWTGGPYDRAIRLCFSAAIKVIDTDGNDVQGASVKIYNSNALTTLGETVLIGSETVSLPSFSFITDASGKIGNRYLKWEEWRRGSVQAPANTVDSLSGHVANNYLTTTVYHPFLVLITKQGYYPRVATLEMGEGKNLVYDIEKQTGVREVGHRHLISGQFRKTSFGAKLIASDVPSDMTVDVSDELTMTEDVEMNVPDFTLTVDVSDSLTLAEDVTEETPDRTHAVDVNDYMVIEEEVTVTIV